MIEVSHLTKYYGRRLAVEDLSFTVEDGQIYGLLGPKGAGKSTVMNILAGCLAASGGRVVVDGHPLPEEAAAARARVGYLPETPPLYPEMTVGEYLAFAAELKGVKKPARAAQVGRAARSAGLEAVLPRLIRGLSKGYRQRVGIAQALQGDPGLVILDEPTVGLDPAQVIEIRRLIRQLGAGRTVLLSSHILSEVQAVCTRVLILSRGRLAAEGAPDELAARLGAGAALHITAQGSRQAVTAAVKGVPGVQAVEVQRASGDEVSLVANCAPGEDRRAAVSGALAAAGCAVLGMRTESGSLEEIYLALTGQGDPAQEEG